MLRYGLLLCVVGLVAGGPFSTKTREEIEDFRQYLEKSRTESGIRLDSAVLSNLQGNIWEHSGKFEGDIILDDWQIEGLLADYAAGRNAYIWPNTKWPGNVVVYEFAANAFNAAEQQRILYAMQVIEWNSCIRFRRRNPNERNFVMLTSRPDGCYASVGYWANRGVHTLNLAKPGCLGTGIVVHEYLHVLGFFHMQSTYNRDNYVRIHLENVVNGMAHNFERYGSNLVSNLNIPYEYVSVMHYSSHAFSRNGRPTIVPLRHVNGVMGQQNMPTWWDMLRLRRHYNCPGAWAFDLELSEKQILLPENNSKIEIAQETEALEAEEQQ